ncbi:MAG: thioredoxin domain-containing protein [Candidatus Nitrosopolaris sp.]
MNENSNSLRNHNTIVESADEENEEIGKLKLPVNDRDHIRGPRTASVNLVEYGDYECPYTGQAYPIVKEIQKRLGDKLLFVFRNFPLREIHPHAQHAAEAAEAAAAQGKFWDMHDYLFEHQQALDDNHLSKYAAALGIDTDKFRKEMSGHNYASQIDKSLGEGIASGVEGTPTFFINGVKHNDSWDQETLLAAINKKGL